MACLILGSARTVKGLKISRVVALSVLHRPSSLSFLPLKQELL